MSALNVSGAANEGCGTAYGPIQSPGNDPYVITAGATKSVDGIRAHDKIATYSGRGPSRLDLVLKPDIVAPGNKVISTYSCGSAPFNYNVANNSLPIQTYSKTTWNGYSTDYFRLSGTSMAPPVVAGAAALGQHDDRGQSGHLGFRPVGDRHHRPAGDLGQFGQRGPGDLGQQHGCRGPFLGHRQGGVTRSTGSAPPGHTPPPARRL